MVSSICAITKCFCYKIEASMPVQVLVEFEKMCGEGAVRENCNKYAVSTRK